VRRRETDVRPPFLFDIAQARLLLEAAAALPDNSRAVGRGATYHAIFALCYGLGLRVGEACGLRIDDVDTGRQLLTVRGGKFGKSRLVPHGPRIGDLLARQVERRHASREDPLFSFDRRRSVNPCSASQTFHHLVAELAFPVPDGVAPPRLHCLRHSFAVGRLTRWYREDISPQERLYRLSTFMGHVDPTSTAVYLTITADLLTEANRRFEALAEPAWTEDTP
jgi:integrase